MNRFKRAWLALTGRLEPEVRVETKTVLERHDVYGEAEQVALFRADDPTKLAWDRFMRSGHAYRYVDPPKVADWHGKHYATCAQAFAECPGANVVEVSVWRIGSDYYRTPELAGIKVQPKPKTPKGRARGRN